MARSFRGPPLGYNLTFMSMSSSWKAMLLLAIATLFPMSLWFSASAVVPALTAEWNLSPDTAAWLTLAVQIGFVAGTLISAFANLPDILNPRYLLAICAASAAASNTLFALAATGPASAIPLRFLTGMFLAGVYPPSMKIMASWFRTGRGAAIGVLIGALTLGKAFPYLINAFQMEQWRQNLLIVSGFALAGGLIVLLLKDGPYQLPSAPFDISQVKKAFANRGVRLANFGYFGHMWELYAMWTWAPVMIRASFQLQGVSSKLAETVAFGTIAAGVAGCVLAGILADRMGRTLIASVAMVISGLCCVFVGFLFHAHPVLLIVVVLIWGASVVADSAQFSTCVTELADPRYIGTALTLQTCVGFLITVITIDLVPWIVSFAGWKYAFVVLAPGPFLGILAMLRLRSLPEAARIAHGKR